MGKDEENQQCRTNADVKNAITRWPVGDQTTPVVLFALTQFSHSMAHMLPTMHFIAFTTPDLSVEDAHSLRLFR